MECVIIKWDSEDARFDCFDGEVFKTKELAEKTIYEYAIAHKNDYYDEYVYHDNMEIDTSEEAPHWVKAKYETWVKWCIKNFCYISPVTVHLE